MWYGATAWELHVFCSRGSPHSSSCRLNFSTAHDVKVPEEAQRTSLHRPVPLSIGFWFVPKYSVCIGGTVVVTPRARVFGVDGKICPSQLTVAGAESTRCGSENLSRSAGRAKVFSVVWKIDPSMLKQSNRQHDARCRDSAPKRLRGSVRK